MLTRILTVLILGSLGLLNNAKADYQVLYNCNRGAAVLDWMKTFEGRTSGPFNSYQFVIRDHGVIHYLLSTGAISPRGLVGSNSEFVASFGRSTASFSQTGLISITLRGGWFDDGFTYTLRRSGSGITFEGRSPWGASAAWFFEDCQQTSGLENVEVKD